MKTLHGCRLEKTVSVIMGTRPGIIKMAPVFHALKSQNIDAFIIHTGQHYSKNMDMAFIKNMDLPAPRYRVSDTKSRPTHGGQTAEMLIGVETALIEAKPKVVLVCGDANTNLAAGLAARKLGIVLGHVEAGLRSYDWTMPEEHNRIVLDHISELLFAPTEGACHNLVNDNVRGKIVLTGNTIVDATINSANNSATRTHIMADAALDREKYILVTAHREENVDNLERLKGIIDGIERAAASCDCMCFFPVHPRTSKQLKEFGLMQKLQRSSFVRLWEPVDYFSSLELIKNAALVLTDSGGIQEEACILHVPCVTLRDNTERPETISVGANSLAGANAESIEKAAIHMKSARRKWPVPFGDGKAAIRIAEEIKRTFVDGLKIADIAESTRAQQGSNISSYGVVE